MAMVFAVFLGLFLAYAFVMLIGLRVTELLTMSLFALAVPFSLLSIYSFVAGIDPGVIKEMKQELFRLAWTDNLPFTLAGVFIVTLYVLLSEGWLNFLFTRRKETARGEKIYAGTGRDRSISQALMGTSTSNFAVESLDIKTTALIKLSLHCISKVNRTNLSLIERYLRLGDGRRYRAFQKIAASKNSWKRLDQIIPPYKRAINNSDAAARLMFKDLCQMAQVTGMTDAAAVHKLAKIGQALGLSPRNMGLALFQMPR